MLKNQMLISILSMVGLIALGALFGFYTADYYKRSEYAEIPGLLWPEPKRLRPFTTIDQRQEVFGIDRLKGKWSFLFFGYTHCPDICPLTMSTLNEAYKNLKADGIARGVQIVFVSVDPDRDDSKKLKNYVEYFNPDFLGIGGTVPQVAGLTSQIGVAYFLHEQGESGDYLVDHSASIFLIDPKGRLLAIFQAPHQSNEISNQFIRIRDFYEHHT